MVGYSLRVPGFNALVVGLLLLQGAPARSSGLMTEKRTAEIVNSGSTNAPGYQISVDESGHVKYTPGKRRNAVGFQEPEHEIEAVIAPEMVKRFFADIDRAGPLSKLPAGHCMKSASFGTVTFVKMGGEQSPDISCPDSDPRIEALYKDAQAIRDAIKTAHSK
ncbi:MAG TPA: hypothetical protein VLZ81_12260 [Blastocatellia bacterium]|nr:hypothetical protein [Blastocatellia bacterium]